MISEFGEKVVLMDEEAKDNMLDHCNATWVCWVGDGWWRKEWRGMRIWQSRTCEGRECTTDVSGMEWIVFDFGKHQEKACREVGFFGRVGVLRLDSEARQTGDVEVEVL